MSARAFASFAAFLAAGLAPVWAQEAAPDVEPLRPPGLIVRPDPDAAEVPLALAAISVDVQVFADLAVTTLDLTYTNPNERVLAGRFVVPLPHGAAPSRFAMDVEGVLREGVVVTREKGRVVFESIVRRGVDPGLLEWVAGNAFRARVFPIPARGTKRLVIAYEHELGPARADGTRRVRVPLNLGAAVGAAGWNLAGHGVRLRLLESPFGDAWTGSGEGVSLDGDLVLAVQDPQGQGALFGATEAGPDGQRYLYAHVPVEGGTRPRPAPKRLTLFWDASLSGAARDRARERALLASYLQALGRVTVELAPFSDQVWFREVFEVQGGDAGALLARIDALPADGGTRLGCLTLGDGPRPDEVLLVSDGLETVAHGAPDLGGLPVFALTQARLADHPRLRELAARGALIDLAALDAPAALAVLRSERIRLQEVTVTQGRVVDLEPAVGTPVEGDRFSVAGRVVSDGPVTLTLTFGAAGGEPQRISLTLGPPGDAATGIVPRIWARLRIARLLARRAQHEEEITELARAFSLVTPFTSLLVLESLEDHVRYDVLPPPGEWRQQFLELRATREAEEAQSRAQRLARVEELWQSRVAWWETEFAEPEGGWRPVLESDGRDGGGEGEHEAVGASLGAPDEPAPEEPTAEPAVPDGPMGEEPMPEEEPAESMADNERAAADDVPVELGLRPVAKADGDGPSPGGGVELAPWSPDRPYLAELAAAGEGAYRKYLALRADHLASPAFFLDCADYFAEEREDRALALRILSCVAELDLGSAPLLRVLAHRYAQLDELELAAAVFAEVRGLRPEEPQSHRDLALVLERLGRFEEAAALLEAVVSGAWDERFPEVELIALGELNRVRARAAAATDRALPSTLPSSLLRLLEVDVRIILTWDADQCDMDLWVVEPTGEKAFYGRRETQIGGRFGADFTRGYGPEEYLLKRAIPGTYTIQINYFGTSQVELTGATTIQVEVVRNWGRPDEVRRSLTRRLSERKETLTIGTITVP